MRSSRLLGVTFTLGLGLVGACTTAIESDEAPSIDNYIQGLPYLPVQPAAITMQDPSAPTPEGDYQCTTQNLQETRQYDKIVAYAANSDSLYPGSIVSADSVISGLFTQIVLPRAPETHQHLAGESRGRQEGDHQEPELVGLSRCSRRHPRHRDHGQHAREPLLRDRRGPQPGAAEHVPRRGSELGSVDGVVEDELRLVQAEHALAQHREVHADLLHGGPRRAGLAELDVPAERLAR